MTSSLDPGGRGPLGRATTFVHWWLLLTVWFVVTSLPAALAALLLETSAGNLAVTVLLMAPVAVAFSASMSAWRDRDQVPDAEPTRAYWRGVRRSWADVLKVVLVPLVVLAIIAVTLANLGVAGVPTSYGWVLAGVALVLVLLTTQGMVIATFFSFRLVDIWRLAVHTLFRHPLVALSLLALMICAGAVVWFSSEAVLLILGASVAAAVLRYERPALAYVRETFTVEGRAGEPSA